MFILRLLVALPPRHKLLLEPEEDPHKQLKAFFTRCKEHALQYGVKDHLDRWWKSLEVNPREQIGDMVFNFFDEISDNHLGG